MTAFSIPVHVGSEPPERWDEIERMQEEAGDSASSWLAEQRRPELAGMAVDWLDLEPRWIGFEAADCAAALQPSIYSGHGATEFELFRQGASNRGEPAVAISRVGNAADDPRSVIFRSGGGVSFPGSETFVASERVGRNARVRAAPDLSNVDADLAQRLINCPTPLTWRALSLHGFEVASWQGTERHDPVGLLQPIVESELGEPVVAVWLSPEGVDRHYIVPIEAPWSLLLRWLTEQALPELAPGVLRRARRGLEDDPSLMTKAERDLRAQLGEFDARQRIEREAIERALEQATTSASQLRHDLLYGSGKALVAAVRQVFEFAGVSVTDLDEMLGDGVNADLLCSFGHHARLVEVRSASGNAAERSYQDMIRHLREWPSLSLSSPVDGGALVISHQTRAHPSLRLAAPYERREFLAAATEPIVTAVDLFKAWSAGDPLAIRSLLFEYPRHGGEIAAVGDAEVASNENLEPLDAESPRRGLRRVLRRWWT